MHFEVYTYLMLMVNLFGLRVYKTKPQLSIMFLLGIRLHAFLPDS